MISKRLLEITKYVKDNSSVIDVGCDHALLDIYLYLHKKNMQILATDISDRAIYSARKNALKYGVEEYIDIKVSNGLELAGKKQFDTLIIAGLGGRNIISILKKGCLVDIENVIVQPNNNIFEVRKYLTNCGYYIKDESLIKEGSIISTTIVFEKGYQKYSKDELFFGPILLKNRGDLFKLKFNKELIHYTKALKNLNKFHIFKFIKLKLKIYKLKKSLK